MEASLSWTHLLTVPEGVQEPTQPRDHSIPLQCDEKEVLFHGSICLPGIQEYQKEGVLIYYGELLGEL